MTIFDQTYAVFSPQFMEEFHDFRKDAMFQKICDCVGVVHVHDGASDKLLGSWESVKKAHDMLTAFLFFRSLNTPMPGTNGCTGVLREASFIEGTSEKEQIFSPMNESSSGTHIERNLKETPSLAMDADFDGHGHVEYDDESFDLDFHYKAELCKVKPQLDLDGRTVYICDMCSYVGHKRHNLVVHKIRSHIRPYKCRKCSRGFGLRKDLRRHHKNKRNCITYGREYKQHCEGRSRLSNFHLLKIEETSQSDTVPLKDCVSKDSIGIANGKENNTNQQNQSTLMESDQPSNNAQEENEMLVSSIKQSESPASQDQSESNVHSEQEQTSHEKGKDARLRTAGGEMATATSKIPASTAVQVTDKPLNFAKIKFEPVESSSGLFEQVKTKDGVQFQCLACKFVSSKKQQVEDHTKRVHCKQFKCSVCGSMFGMKKDLNRHYRRSHNMHLNCRRRSQLELHFVEKK